VENVKGFETSSAYQMLAETLSGLGFDSRTFLISPTQLGVPNSRLRCYILARKRLFPEKLSREIITDLNGVADEATSEPDKIVGYLDQTNTDEFLLDDKCLSKHAEVLDIVTSQSAGSCCFTKSYGRYAEGTGSVLQQTGDLDDIYRRAREVGDRTCPEYAAVLRDLRLRYFTPDEVARLMGFDNSFTFPPDFRENKLHCFRVLGNSLNVKVVSFLATILFKE